METMTLDTPLLRQLIGAGKAGELVAKGIPGGFVLVMREGIEEQVLEAQRGHPRVFKRLDTIGGYLRQLGAREFTVDLAYWEAGSLVD